MQRLLLSLTLAATLTVGCETGDPAGAPADGGLPDGPVVDFHVYPDSVYSDGGFAPERKISAYETVVELTSPPYTGRKSGTPGGTKAAKYIATRLAGCGLEPFGDKSLNYLHEFKVTPIIHTGKMTMSVTKAGSTSTPSLFTYRKHWRPGRTSPGGDLTAPLFFVGYGLDLKKHDDYKQINVAGGIVFAFRGCPPGVGDNESCNDVAKVQTAKKYKAKGYILLSEDDYSVNIWGGSQGHEMLPILTAVMKQGPAQAFLPAGKTFKSVREALNTKGPGSFSTGLKMRLLLSRKAVKDASAYNVLGVIRAAGASVKKYVVAGAHYDHLGFDMPPFLYFPGALDNASGTSVVIDAACRLAADKKLGLKRNLVFGLWGAEEDGLIGSRLWLESAKLKPTEIDYSVNLDMVGGKGSGPLFVDISPADSSVLEPPLKKIATTLKTLAQFGTVNTGRSDHASFMAKGIPAVYLYGPHPQAMEYHTAADNPGQLSASKLDELSRLLTAMLKDLASR